VVSFTPWPFYARRKSSLFFVSARLIVADIRVMNLPVRSQNSSIGVAGQGSIPGRCNKFFSTPQLPYEHWGIPNVLLNWYRELISWG
jgi:hypothetical protein